MKFTKQLRAEIIGEFAKRHGGNYNPPDFLEEVEKAGESHPAHAWFTWDDSQAAHEYRIWQARVFASNIRVSFSVRSIGRDTPMTIKSVEAPMAISPLNGRSRGGGYVITNPTKGHMVELCRQAEDDLRSWLRRYEAAVQYVGISAEEISGILGKLKSASAKPKRNRAEATQHVTANA